uniref:LEAF RUST 10 DISEASE-RESISTANCE LOCUS RECEPTOR-LIKE PROTEIN KINASE-like 2.1 isoform X2 n=1 Tax=Elaeis guineensis var. tenera TaxID=51953 RepID=A0A6J0P9I5_ELAGV|nr:LEAF RUST 10 DISEASE-RESISTANCE LOCUS RECEPTOR-LIKE PROTEIN KINASE-like 2.1 isoform X2 [Elaeis guineensis]
MQPAIPIPIRQHPMYPNPPLFGAPFPPSMGPRRLASIIAILLLASPTSASGEDCRPSSCGDLRNISDPFRLTTDPSTCGDPQYQLTCDQNRAVLKLYSTKYYVAEISYEDLMARVVLAGLDSPSCSPRSLPFLPPSKFKYGDPFALNTTNNSVIFVTCPASSVGEPSYIPIPFCVDNSTSSKEYLYALAGDATVADLRKSCATAGTVPMAGMLQNRTQAAVRDVLLRGFYISWKVPIQCRDCVAEELQCKTLYSYNFGRKKRDGPCYWNKFRICTKPLGGASSFFSCLGDIIEEAGTAFLDLEGLIILPGRTIIGISCLMAYLVYKLRRRHRSMDNRIEDFLNDYRNSMPIRYSYRHIKKMTNQFKEKLGQGGYGSVFKGKLTTGRLVAIKILEKAKGNGQEFINEVSTIGRIHHTNVVQLIGFCFEGSNRALIYEFMSNGSLDKYIFSQEEEAEILSWEKMQDIALGIARGIEYLHRGCDMQILHFDIKPHNILLDDKFNPKVSDFGLAKLHPIEESKVLVTAVRGTIGYMAPELFYRKVGEISYKSDVYSFGMLLMEMAGRRKNLNPHAPRSSQIYFPSWIYDQLYQGRDLEMEDATDDEKEIAKKLLMIALRCIQMNPAERPSMSQVVEMLEKKIEDMQMPTKPFLSSLDKVFKEDHTIDEEDHTIDMEASESLYEPGSNTNNRSNDEIISCSSK